MAGLAKRASFKQQLYAMTSERSRMMDVDDMDTTEYNPEDPPQDGDTTIEDLPEDCLGLILELLNVVTVATFEKSSRHIYNTIQAHQYWRKAFRRLLKENPYLRDKAFSKLGYTEEPLEDLIQDGVRCKKLFKDCANELSMYWKKSQRYRPKTIRNSSYFCERDERQKIVSFKVTGDHMITVLGPRTRSDLKVYAIKVFDRGTQQLINEIPDMLDRPEYLVFSAQHNILVTKAHESTQNLPDTLNMWSLHHRQDPFLRAYHLKSSGQAARNTALILRENIFFGSCKKDCVLMVPTRYSNKSMVRFLGLKRTTFDPISHPKKDWKADKQGDKYIKTNNGLIFEGFGVGVEEVGRIHIPHLVQLGVADFSEKWAVLFSEAPKELPDRNIHLIVIDMSAMAIKHIVKAYEPRIAVYGASLHTQEPDIAVAVGKDGYLKVFDLDCGRELTNQRVPKPMARTNTAIMDFFGTTRFMLGSITDIHVFDLQFPLYPSPEAKVDRIERRREHIRTVSIYGEVWDMVEERALQLAPPPGQNQLDPLMQLQQNLAALNQVNQAIEANIVRPELPEEADRVEQLMVEFRAVQQRIHDLNQEMEARISVAIEAVAADLRNVFVLTNTGDIMTFDFWESSPLPEGMDDDE